VSSDSARRDSTTTIADLFIVRDARGMVARVMRNDSVGRLDSLPPLPVDRAGRWNPAQLVVPCRDLGLLPSPLVVRLLQPRAASSWPVRDSLSYTLCTRGAPRTVIAQITWLEPVPAIDRSTYAQIVQVSGQLQGDSTRAFPMRLMGVLRGEARLEVTATDGRLVGSTGSFTIDLTAAANTQLQRATQVVSFVATPQ
jgi:hypothetical protein